MQIELTGVSNLGALTADLKRVQLELAKTAALADTVWSAGSKKGYINPQAFAQLERAGKAGHEAFAQALASSSQWRVEQVKVASATDTFTQRLKKQQVSLKELRQNQNLVNAAYKEQIKLMNSAAFTSQTRRTSGRDMISLAIPTAADIKQVDNFGNKLKWMSAEWQSVGTIIQNSGKNIQWAGRQLTVGLSVPIAAFGAAAGKLAYDLDHGLVQVTKVYNTTANQFSKNVEEQTRATKELDDVRQNSTRLAMRMAKEYGASMQDTLDVESQLAATGLKGQELYKSTAAAMRAAMLGELDYNDTISTTIALQSKLGLNAKQTADAWNYMNNLENQTSLTMQDMATAIPIALGPVSELGGSLQDLGTMMAAMKANGINASQGANALKSSLQRLLRPTKQVREEFKAITGQSITGIVEGDKGDMMKIMTDLYNVTKNLDRVSRGKVFAGLFGTYQVSRMMALVDSMGKLQKGVGQVSTAFNIGQKSAKDWGQVAQGEVDQVQKSISLKFKSSVEALKVSLAEVGTPFLKAGTTVLNVVNDIIKAFNNLPSSIKNVAAVGLLLVAIFGPITMFIGLMKNFGGTLIKGAAQVIGLDKVVRAFGGNLELLTAQEQAQRKQLEIMQQGFAETSGSVQNATAAISEFIQAMTYAQRYERNMWQDFHAGQLMNKENPVTKEKYTVAEAQAEALAARRQAESDAKPRYRYVVHNGEVMSQEAAAAAAATAASAEKEAAARQKSAKYMNASKVAGGIMAASIAASLVSSNDLVDSAVKWSMVVAGVVPVFSMIRDLVKTITAERAAGGLLATLGGNVKGGLAKSAIGRGVAGFAAKRAAGAGIGAALGGAAAGIGGLTLATGGLALAAAGVGAAFYAWHKHVEDTRKEMKKLADEQKAVNDAGQEYLKTLGLAQYKYHSINVAGMPGATDQQMNQMDRAIGVYTNTKQGKQLASAYRSAGDLGKQTILMKQFRTVMGATNGDIKQAQKAMTAFLTATGDNIIDATRKARDFANTFSSMGKNLDSKLLSNEIKRALTVDDAQIANAGKDVGRTFGDAFARGTASQKQQLLSTLSSSINEGLKNLVGQGPAQLIKQYGITNQQILNMMNMSSKTGLPLYTQINQMADRLGVSRKDMNIIFNAVRKAPNDKMERFASLWQNTAISIGDLRKYGVKTLAQIGNSPVFQMMTSDKSNRASLAEKLMGSVKDKNLKSGLAGLGQDVKAASGSIAMFAQSFDKSVTPTERAKQAIATYGKQTALAKLNVLRANAGLKATNNIFDWMGPVSHKAADGVDDVGNSMDKGADKTNRMSAALKAFNSAMKSGWLNQAGQQAMTDTIGDVATMVQNNFAAAQQAAEEANSQMWQRRQDALQNHQQAAQDALQRRQQAAQNAMEANQQRHEDAISARYDHRIDKINKEIKAEQHAEDIRQKIFAAEQKRLDRLKEQYNSRIDFNVAIEQGNFDEAAKIQKDMQTTLQQNALDDAAAAGQDKVQNRVDKQQERIDKLNKEKDQALKHYRAIEDRQQAHLKKMQDAESRALQHRQQEQSRALEREQKASEKATTAMWKDRQDKLQLALDDLNSYIPTSEADLQQHIKNVAKKYDVFGDNLNKTTSQLHTMISNDYDRKMKEAANKLRSDIAWKSIGKDILNQMVLGPMGFDGMGQFKHFMTTGEMPQGGGGGHNEHHPTRNAPRHGSNAGGKYRAAQAAGLARHKGGEINANKGSRNGIPMNAPLRSNEYNVTAEHGEFMVNKRATAKHRPLLEAINEGKSGTDVGKYATGGYGGPLAMMGAFMAPLMQGIKKNFENAYQNKMTQMMSSMFGAFGSPGAGTFGGINLSAEQVKNALTIANVGKSMHMSARDIEIALMTAMQESGLRNLHYGDRDSQGLFQQRPSMGWGTVAQVTNPQYAAHTFFDHLRGVAGRDGMPMTLAAQAVQRSAYPYAYAKWHDMALALFKALRKNGGGIAAGFIPGKGGKHRPVNGGHLTQGIHDSYTGFPAIDIGVPVGTPVYAVGSGRIGMSKDYRGNDGRVSNGGYYSYGRYITLNLDGGGAVNYAHLSARYARAGQRVEGGSVIGRSGNTGHSFGPHLHFGAHPMSPYSFYPQMKTGGYTLSDGLAMLHKKETVLTAPLSEKLQQGIQNFAENKENTYNLNFYGVTDKDEIATHVIKVIKREEARKPQKRSNKN